jgi:Rrf2 family transcriptional regulator, nitric oxide-sensitive transcriptional repressor
MRLTTFSDYSLRVLVYLAVHRDRLATIAEIAQAYGVSENHLMKVVHQLAQRGHVETIRGKGGGIRLARPPAAINIGAVVRETEDNTAFVECFEPETSNCRIAPACQLRRIIGDAIEAFFAMLDRYTLADVVANRPRLERLIPLREVKRAAAPG